MARPLNCAHSTLVNSMTKRLRTAPRHGCKNTRTPVSSDITPFFPVLTLNTIKHPHLPLSIASCSDLLFNLPDPGLCLHTTTKKKKSSSAGALAIAMCLSAIPLVTGQKEYTSTILAGSYSSDDTFLSSHTRIGGSIGGLTLGGWGWKVVEIRSKSGNGMAFRSQLPHWRRVPIASSSSPEVVDTAYL